MHNTPRIAARRAAAGWGAAARGVVGLAPRALCAEPAAARARNAGYGGYRGWQWRNPWWGAAAAVFGGGAVLSVCGADRVVGCDADTADEVRCLLR